jgi:hypothetical protein
MLESYFRNNADLGTGLLMARFAITSPHFFKLHVSSPPAYSSQMLQLTGAFLHLKQSNPQFLKSGLQRASLERSPAIISDISTVRTKMSHLET